MLSDEIKYKVIFALCHTGEILNPQSMYFNSLVRDRLAVDNLHIEERVQFLLSEIDRTEGILRNAPSKANLKRIGDIELDNTGGVPLIKSELKRLKNELSQLLDIPNACRSGSNVCVVV